MLRDSGFGDRVLGFRVLGWALKDLRFRLLLWVPKFPLNLGDLGTTRLN